MVPIVGARDQSPRRHGYCFSILSPGRIRSESRAARGLLLPSSTCSATTPRHASPPDPRDRRPARLPPVPPCSLSDLRPPFWFLLGAATMAVLTLVLFYVAPRGLPPGGVAIHLGPNPPRPVRVAAAAPPPPAPAPA